MSEKEQEVEGTSDEQYDYENEQIEILFPDAKFTISMSLEDLDEVVTDQPHIVIKHAYNCYCYDEEEAKNTEFYYISGKNLTNKDIIESLIEQGLTLECNHHFLEGFHKTASSDVQFEICTGS
jgi:Na+-transporting NADH:ubiquinone oxidoreductase subunit NqrF